MLVFRLKASVENIITERGFIDSLSIALGSKPSKPTCYKFTFERFSRGRARFFREKMGVQMSDSLVELQD